MAVRHLDVYNAPGSFDVADVVECLNAETSITDAVR